jgi:hypothetical protein
MSEEKPSTPALGFHLFLCSTSSLSSKISLMIFFFLVGLGFELRALYLQRRQVLEPYLQFIFALVILEMGVLKLRSFQSQPPKELGLQA